MNKLLQSSKFLELQAAGPGPFAPNVTAIQYGGLHTGIIDRGLDAGFHVVEVVPSGIDLEGSQTMREIASFRIEQALKQIEVIDELLASQAGRDKDYE